MNRGVTFKVVLLGEGSVGKTSIVLRYTENSFNDKHIETEQASFRTKKLILDGRRVELSIWDTAGQERYRALGPLYFREANGAILVFDITDQDSFNQVKDWVKQLKRVLGDDVVLCIVANKADLEKDRHVSMQTAEEYASAVNAKLYNTSAKLNKGIEELFNNLTQRMLEKTPPTPNISDTNGVNGRTGISIQQNPTNPTANNGCC
ncbi:unnamed protein product [Rotaria socialis]|uniref:Ras-related protein Rab-21 n=1 Tax=Rotaria socialis TaxID=392032 RepID=A0A817W7M7_9BILA|nr:unnamed protein product [Rotaria socialis]CAF3352270.1 unnamed protein product [Rotaria socialis]CAF3598400.1 unnamed protein product [Rotaria socialis]CAF3642881.1 unnamed protein product [Rotaria socialis]CAF3790367.1 unnamed protein product [Rotaria socialis]